MKKRSALLLLFFCGVLAGVLAIGMTTLLRPIRPRPYIECEAMRPLNLFQ